MRVSRVFLRRYKSFNVSLGHYPDRRVGNVQRPWNALGVGKDGPEFGFIEIPIEEDVTTIVGANESGKSHLLSGLSKVLTGKGGPGDLVRSYGRTDLCHFPGASSANSDVWPEIGIELTGLDDEEWERLGETVSSLATEAKPSRVVLLLSSDCPENAALMYLDNAGPTHLTSDQLHGIRKVTPRLRFINARLAINDHVDLGTLISAYAGNRASETRWFTAKAAEEAARAIVGLTINANNQIDSGSVQNLAAIQSLLKAQEPKEKDAALEALLFRDVLGIEVGTLEYLSSRGDVDRTYVDSVVANWNRLIDERLNLSRYWQQDDQFILRANLKKGTIFFEITDKTGAVYTFRERSSGLKYFLSYYIQAKAIERSGDKHGIVLMDEPDSFLSVVGQRNLLSVFESLVSADESRRNTQLIYTTHSPFLINRNFPRRLRLVRKGDGEEGTVLVDEERVRRYEPVRSALGIDCAQTMFMGATNLVLEGPVDQYLLCELVRIFSDRSNVHSLLDLNDVVVVSAESASRIGKLLESSLWEDEPNPAVVVLVDSDSGGDEAKKQITGQSRNAKKRIEPEFVRQIGEMIGPKAGEQRIVTSEDLVPPSIYRQALKDYIGTFMPDWKPQTVRLDDSGFGRDGLGAAAESFFRTGAQEPVSLDKLGLAESVIGVVSSRFAADPKDPELLEIKARVVKLCVGLRDVIAESRSRQRRQSTRQALVRHVQIFLRQHHQGSALFALEQLVKRLSAELEILGKEGLSLTERLQTWREEVTSARQAGDDRVSTTAWPRTKEALRALQHDPFGELPVSLLAEPVAEPEAAPTAAVTVVGVDIAPRAQADVTAASGGHIDQPTNDSLAHPDDARLQET